MTSVQELGCGLEAQLESWYRFLIQPDPWDSITLSADALPLAQLTDVDRLILKQRKDFLREDSLVAMIMLTDEEDTLDRPARALRPRLAHPHAELSVDPDEGRGHAPALDERVQLASTSSVLRRPGRATPTARPADSRETSQ